MSGENGHREMASEHQLRWASLTSQVGRSGGNRMGQSLWAHQAPSFQRMPNTLQQMAFSEDFGFSWIHSYQLSILSV